MKRIKYDVKYIFSQIHLLYYPQVILLLIGANTTNRTEITETNLNNQS